MRNYYGGTTHELQPEAITTIPQVMSHLCDLPPFSKQKHTPEMCTSCEAQCRYGKRWLELLAAEGVHCTGKPPVDPFPSIRSLLENPYSVRPLKETLRRRAKERRA